MINIQICVESFDSQQILNLEKLSHKPLTSLDVGLQVYRVTTLWFMSLKAWIKFSFTYFNILTY